MFLPLFSIEWTRLARRAWVWGLLALCGLYLGLGQANYYQTNYTALATGTLKMPGMAFDVANALDQLTILIPVILILAGTLVGNDYSQRTYQHWLMRAPRHSSLLAKFAVLALLTFAAQAAAMLLGWAVGAYYKAGLYHVPNANNLDPWATLAAPFYMTLAYLPYLALGLLFTVAVRSTFFGVMLGLGYTLGLEFVSSGFFYGQAWTKWLLTNVHFSVSFWLNLLGRRTPTLPAHILAPGPALATAALYTLVLLGLAIGCYRRQDIGG